jgi:hypothetical protein
MSTLIHSRAVKLNNRQSSSGYNYYNAKSRPARARRLGSNMTAINQLLAYPNFNTKVVSKIIRNASTDVMYDKRVEEYFDSLSIIVPVIGKDLDISLRFKTADEAAKYKDSETTLRKEYNIKMSSTNDYNEQRSLYEDRTSRLINMEEEILGTGVVPVNIEHYMIWRYALINNEVSNREQDVNISSNIRFYITDKIDTELAKVTKDNQIVAASTKFNEIIADKVKVGNLYDVLIPHGVEVELIGKQTALLQYIMNNPAKFVATIKDVDLAIRGDIERYIKSGIFKRYPSSTLIIDAMTQDTIGRNVEEAVQWFKNPDNKEIIVKYSNRSKF